MLLLKISGKQSRPTRQSTYVTLLIAFLCPVVVFAQFNDQPRRAEVVVKVFVDSMPQRAPSGITVQLLDGFGTVELESHTDGSGQVQFTTLSGEHSLRIFGRGIEEFSGGLEILPVEMHKTENVVVRRSARENTTSTPGSATVDANRLNIPQKAQHEFDSGSKALGRKDWQEAKKRFDAAIAIFPGYDLAYNGLGDADLASGDIPAARTAFKQAIGLNKNFAEPYRNLARIAFVQHNYEEADTLLVESLAIDPMNARALTYAANAELLLHKYSEALEHSRRVHRMPHEGLAAAHIVAARALEATQQGPEAVKEYRLYLAEDPQGRDAPIAHDAIARLEGSPK